MNNNLEKIKIILVEPSGAINLGSIARLCKNFGIKELRLVNPICDPTDPLAIKMSVKGKDILINSKKYNSLSDAISDCRVVIATAGRIDDSDIPFSSSKNAFEWFYTLPMPISTALVFGREDRGLSNKELLLAQEVITLNPNQDYKSLNLSHAVAIVLNELNNFINNMNIKSNYKEISEEPALSIELKNFFEDAESLLLEIGFLLEHTANARMAKFKGLIHRSRIKSAEVALIRGMIRQVRWAIKTKHY